MTLAELLFSILSQRVTPSSSPSPVPWYTYQYQHPRHLQDASHQSIKPAYQNKSSDSFIRFPFKVLNNIVGYKKKVFNDIVSIPSIEQSVPHFINEIIDIKKNEMNQNTFLYILSLPSRIILDKKKKISKLVTNKLKITRYISKTSSKFLQRQPQ